MTIRLYRRKDFRGDSATLTGDAPALRKLPVGAHPSSIELTSDDDVVLLFGREDFHGPCLWRRGRASIADLGSGKDGGKLGFGNTIASARVTPFVVKLNVTVVRDERDRLPGAFAQPVAERVADIVALANERLASLKTLMTLVVADVDVRDGDRKFDVDAPRLAAYPPAWKKPGQLDVVICNTTRVKGEAGVAKPPCLGQVVLLSARVKFTDPITGADAEVNLAEDMMAFTLLHELGHYLGVHHLSGKRSATNVMSAQPEFNAATGGLSTPDLADTVFSAEQIEDMQNTLARNPARRLDRS